MIVLGTILVLLTGWQPANQPGALERARKLVAQLGDSRFEVREEAADALLKLGSASLDALREGTKSSDPEIRKRCDLLLPKVLEIDRKVRYHALLEDSSPSHSSGLPAWNNWSRVVGTDKPSRLLYIQVHRQMGDLLEAMEKDPAEATRLMTAVINRLPAQIVLGKKDQSLTVVLSGLLFAEMDPRVRLEVPTQENLHRAIQLLGENKDFRTQLQSQTELRCLFQAFVQRQAGPSLLERRLAIVNQLHLTEVIPWALALAADRNQSVVIRARAVLLVGQLGTPKHLSQLEPLLADTTVVGTRILDSKLHTAELRDVVLTALIYGNREKPADYGIPYFNFIPGLKALPDPACLGFVQQAEREAALARWKARKR